MAKVSFLGTFPRFDSNPCYDLTYWGGLDLTQAMAAYWKVKTWAIQVQINYQTLPPFAFNGVADMSSPAGGSPAITETDLVCPSNRTFDDFTITSGAFGEDGPPVFEISPEGWALTSSVFEFISFVWPSETTASLPISIPIEVTIGDFTTVINGACEQNDPYDTVTGGSGSIQAVELWPYND